MTFTHGKTTEHRALLIGPDDRVRYVLECRNRRTIRLAAACWFLQPGESVYFVRKRKGQWVRTGKTRSAPAAGAYGQH
jgi:hypothetical protein